SSRPTAAPTDSAAAEDVEISAGRGSDQFEHVVDRDHPDRAFVVVGDGADDLVEVGVGPEVPESSAASYEEGPCALRWRDSSKGPSGWPESGRRIRSES